MYTDVPPFGNENLFLGAGRSLMTTYLYEQPGGNQGQAAVLAIEPEVVGVERVLVQEEESATRQQMRGIWLLSKWPNFVWTNRARHNVL